MGMLIWIIENFAEINFLVKIVEIFGNGSIVFQVRKTARIEKRDACWEIRKWEPGGKWPFTQPVSYYSQNIVTEWAIGTTIYLIQKSSMTFAKVWNWEEFKRKGNQSLNFPKGGPTQSLRISLFFCCCC